MSDHLPNNPDVCQISLRMEPQSDDPAEIARISRMIEDFFDEFTQLMVTFNRHRR